MPCSDCTPKVVYTYSSPYSNTTSCTSQASSVTDTGSIKYNGATLTCAGVDTGSTLEVALQKIDTKLCSVLGDYSTYDTHCLDDITTEKQFVEAISDKYCTLQSDYDTFTGTTYVTDKTTLTNLINTNNVPNITSSCTDIFNPISTDTVKGVLQKVSNAICAIYGTALDLSSVDWDSCYTVTDAPETIQEGFGEVITQICALKTSIGDFEELPTFDNSSNCLDGSATDSLSTTIGKITTKLCSTPTFNINTLTWNCVTKPTTSDSTDLQKAFQTVLSTLDSLKSAMPIFSSDFITSASGCGGTNVSIGTSISDKKVGATSSDSNPGSLEDKLYAGDNITLDYATTPGKVIITSTGGGSGSGEDEKVKAFSSDTTAGYLVEKLSGDADNIISIEVASDISNKKVKISADYDAYDMFTDLLTTLNDLPTTDPLFQLFCAVKNKCPESCGGVTDVTVNYYPSSTTTTTTTSSS